MVDYSRWTPSVQAAKEKAFQEALAARKAAEDAKVAEHQALSEMRRAVVIVGLGGTPRKNGPIFRVPTMNFDDVLWSQFLVQLL